MNFFKGGQHDVYMDMDNTPNNLVYRCYNLVCDSILAVWDLVLLDKKKATVEKDRRFLVDG